MASEARPADEPFLHALLGEDELGVVVRAHIHIEAQLNPLIDLLVPRPDLLPGLRYEQRARVACAVGFPEAVFAPLRVFGSIRSRFAHKLHTSLSAAMVDELYNAFSQDDRALSRKGYAAI